MPLATVRITGPKPAEYKQELLAIVRSTIVDGLVAPDERVVVRVCEDDSDCVDTPDCRTDRFTVVEVLLYAGRSADTKRAFVRLLRERLAITPGIEPSDVAVAFHDKSMVDLDVLPGEATQQ